MNELRDPLENMCQTVSGAVSATLMSSDGLPLENVVNDSGEVDIESLLIEYSTVMTQVKNSAQMLAAGDLTEFTVAADGLTTIIRPINEEFFLALTVAPGGNTGKGRYLLRVSAPKLLEALS